MTHFKYSVTKRGEKEINKIGHMEMIFINVYIGICTHTYKKQSVFMSI